MKIALIGNPNSGKTSLFNKLTGLNQKVGNWPGVTIEKKTGKILKLGADVVDLPGIYSLSPYTSEEMVSRDYLLKEKPDAVVNIVDANALERSLFLTSQLLELDVNVVLAINMSDILEKKGLLLDEEKLSQELGVTAIKISAKTGEGIDKLLEVIKLKKFKTNTKKWTYSGVLENEIKKIGKETNFDNKFLLVESLQNGEFKTAENSKKVIEKIYKEDIEQVIANEKYEFISSVKNKCLTGIEKQNSISNKLDKILLNKWLAIPIFACVMTFVYWFSISLIGSLFSDYLGGLISKFSNFTKDALTKLGASKWAVSLVSNGVISGVGSVLTFLPELVVIFLFMSILESTGYMSRIALMFDRIFQKFGLSGKSLVPFIIGTGCSVPAISSTRTIENSDERVMTVMLSPFVPCSAKLPIIALFVGYFFPNNTGFVTTSLYFLAIVIILISSLCLRKFIFKNKVTSFISELPEYKMPSARYVFRDVFDKTIDFVKRVGTIIIFCSVLVWFLSSFDCKFQYITNIESSILASIGKLFAWFFYPIIGQLNWAVSISAIQGLVAKEQVVSSLAVIAGVESGGISIFSSSIFSCFNSISAYSFVLFNLFSAPCVSAIGAMKNELKSTKKTIFVVVFQIVTAWVISSLVFLIGSLLWGGWMIDFVILALLSIFLIGVFKTRIFSCSRCKRCKKRKICKSSQEK